MLNSCFLQRFPVDQRNGDGEAKCPAGRARVCPTVLHPPEPGSRLPAQVASAEAGCIQVRSLHPLTPQLVFQVLWEELLLRPRRLGQQRETSGGCLRTICEFTHTHTHSHIHVVFVYQTWMSALFVQEIHKRVMALSFRDCHTKIRHVDAHATMNEGVVVQVMGELSNNMQPMRKFMQTFVLAPEVGAPAFISSSGANPAFTCCSFPSGNRRKQVLRAQRRVPVPGRGVCGL